jgi:hypothetical protein
MLRKNEGRRGIVKSGSLDGRHRVIGPIKNFIPFVSTCQYTQYNNLLT